MHLYFFNCTLADDDTKITVHAPFRWVSMTELAQLNFPPANRDVLRRLRDQHGAEATGG